jgi:hypothetical protein
MPTPAATEVLEVLSQILEPAQADELRNTLQARSPQPDDLAGELLHRGWLTPYQAHLLGQGRGPDLLLGSYVVLERLGEGGMGTVFKARHRKLGRVVALKVVRTEQASRPDSVRRFRREIQATAQLNHPHLVRAYDAEEAAGTRFLVLGPGASCTTAAARTPAAGEPRCRKALGREAGHAVQSRGSETDGRRECGSWIVDALPGKEHRHDK